MKTKISKKARPAPKRTYPVKRKLYFAYGSNLNKDQFFRRCPWAREFGRFTMPDWRLVFDRVADIVPSPGDVVEGAIYEITPDCERRLDRYEGFPHLYVKETFKVQYTLDGERVAREVMVYSMLTVSISPPTPAYLATIRAGFDDWNIPHDTLDAAHRESIAEAP
jgi:Gamma-glutamyl cyclotransferase, AIG2-like